MDRRASRADFGYAKQLLVLTVAYVVTGVLGLALGPVNTFASIVWPPTALSLVALVIGGYRLWPGVAVGAIVTNLWAGAPSWVACSIGLGNTLEALAGAFALRRVPGFQSSLSRFLDVIALAVVGVATPILSATVGTTSLVLGGMLSASGVARTWSVWWTGDFMSDLILAPVLLTWMRGSRVDPRRAPATEAAALGASLVAVAVLVFFGSPAARGESPVFLPSLLFVPLIWAAVRFGTQGAATAGLLVTTVAVWGTFTGHGAFVRADPTESLIALHVFLLSASLPLLALGAVVCELERSRRDLRDSEERQRLAAFAGKIGMWFWDLGTGDLVWTALCRSIHGIAPDEEVSYDRFLAALHPEDRARTSREVMRSIEEHTDYRIEHRAVWPDGSVHWVAGLGRPFYDREGTPDRMLGVAIDVTAQKRSEEDRAALLGRERSARAEAQAATRAKDEFLAVLSHELRTPLQAMSGWTQILKTRAGDPGLLEKGLTTIGRNVDIQMHLIEDLLDVSRIVSGKLRLEKTRVDVADIVRAAVESARSAVDARSIRLDMEMGAGTDGAVLGDPDRLQQVVANLLTNAVKFTPSGGRIGVRIEREGSVARIVVEDSGCGMAPELVPRVFDRFRQGDNGTTRREGGLGLGLSIVRHIVEMHGGKVQAESPGEGRGATFTVTLPVMGPWVTSPSAP
jgi:PAS domain S-box-containing protein